MEDVAACISSGNCVIVTKIAYYSVYVMAVLLGLLLTYLILSLWFTPVLTFIKARISGKPIFYIVNRAQRAKFITGQPTPEGIAKVKGFGQIQLTENSHTTTKGVNVFVVFSEFIGTIPLYYPAIIEELRNFCIISKWKDYADVITTRLNQLKNGTKTEQQPYTDALTEVTGINKALEAEEIKIQQSKTIPLHNLAFMFPYNWSPSAAETYTENRVALARRAFAGAIRLETVIIIVTFLVGLTIAAVILWKFFGPQATATASSMVETVANQANIGGASG